RGAEIDAVNDFWAPPLVFAASYGHPETVKLLLARGANPDSEKALYSAQTQGFTTIVEMLKKAMPARPPIEEHHSEMDDAVKSGDRGKVEALLGHGTDPDDVLHLAVTDGPADIVKFLLEQAADPNLIIEPDMPVLFEAVQ